MEVTITYTHRLNLRKLNWWVNIWSSRARTTIGKKNRGKIFNYMYGYMCDMVYMFVVAPDTTFY